MKGNTLFKKIWRLKYIYFSYFFFGLIYVYSASNLFSDIKIVKWLVIILLLFMAALFGAINEDKNKDYYSIRNKKEKMVWFFYCNNTDNDYYNFVNFNNWKLKLNRENCSTLSLH